MNILELNDDCLYCIFSYLNLADLVELNSVSERFNDITTTIFSTQHNLIIEMRTVQLDKIENLLKCIGCYLKSLSISIGYLIPENMILPILVPVSKFCYNLNKLTVNYLKMESRYKDLLMKITNKIEYLDIACCDIDDDFQDFLLSCKNVHTLILNGNQRFRGICLTQMNCLRVLIIEHNTGIHNYILDELRKNSVEIITGV